MKKYNIDTSNPPKNIKKLAEYLIAEVMSAGGDGDCHVYCKCYEAKELAKVVWNELEIAGHQQWWEYKELDGSVNIHDSQACFRFTNDLDEDCPSWSQCTITI